MQAGATSLSVTDAYLGQFLVGNAWQPVGPIVKLGRCVGLTCLLEKGLSIRARWKVCSLLADFFSPLKESLSKR